MTETLAQIREIELLLRKQELIQAHNALAAFLQAWPKNQPLSKKVHQLYSQLEDIRDGR